MGNPFYRDRDLHTRSKSNKSKPTELTLKDHLDLTLFKHKHKDPNLCYTYRYDYQVLELSGIKACHISIQTPRRMLKQIDPMKEEAIQPICPSKRSSTTV